MYYGGCLDSGENIIAACHSALAIWNTLIPDGNFLFYHYRISRIYKLLARHYACLRNRDEVITSLKMALKHAQLSDEQPAGEQYYTSIFLRDITSNAGKTSKNYSDTDVQYVLWFMEEEIFDFVRDDPEFTALKSV